MSEQETRRAAPVDLKPEKLTAIMFGYMTWMAAGVEAYLWRTIEAFDEERPSSHRVHGANRLRFPR